MGLRTHTLRCGPFSCESGVICDIDLWVHHPTDREPTMPPVVAHDNGCNMASAVPTPPCPKRLRKDHTRTNTSMPTTTDTTCSRRVEEHPPPKDGGYLSNGDSTPKERFTRHDPTPRCHLEGTSLPAWMDGRHIFAYQEVVWCMGEVL